MKINYLLYGSWRKILNLGFENFLSLCLHFVRKLIGGENKREINKREIVENVKINYSYFFTACLSFFLKT